ncbi:MAG: cytidylate kinase-like family protein [Clostridia bacterium]|nr:cytidylate kinase-like family protein [Clostridia bacterium]
MRIITVSREFGSGGRELGKRIADALSIPCYDKQIIEMVAEKEELDPAYVANRSGIDLKSFYPTTIARGFSRTGYVPMRTVNVMSSEVELIKKLALAGDCVIVGRAADIILADAHPFRIFVCASDESKLVRCRQRADSGEAMSDREILRRCREIDKSRASYRALFTNENHGGPRGYDLCINTSGKEIKTLALGLIGYIDAWFSEEVPK